MRNTKELSLLEMAYQVLLENKEPMDIYDLFDKVCELKEVEESTKPSLIPNFYSDVTTSARFVYCGENNWDLKEKQKIELWEKDGSFYKEYTEIEMPEKEEPVKPTPKPVVKETTIEVKEEPKEEVIAPEKDASVELEKPVEEPIKAPQKEEETEEEYEEDIFEDLDDDDFDEDKYNEYMDTYEDKYDD